MVERCAFADRTGGAVLGRAGETCEPTRQLSRSRLPAAAASAAPARFWLPCDGRGRRTKSNHVSRYSRDFWQTSAAIRWSPDDGRAQIRPTGRYFSVGQAGGILRITDVERTISGSPTTRAWQASSRAPRPLQRSTWFWSGFDRCGLTGWEVPSPTPMPRSVATAIDEMIAPQVRGLEVPRGGRHSRLYGSRNATSTCSRRYGITMLPSPRSTCAVGSGREGSVPLHRLIGTCRRERIPAYAEPAAHRQCGSRCQGVRGGAATRLSSHQAAWRPRCRPCLPRARLSATASR